MKNRRAHGQPRPPHLLRDQARASRRVAPSIAEMYADVLGAGLAKSLADCCTKNTYTSETAGDWTKLRGWRRWIAQGRPREVPVVVVLGWIDRTSDGRRVVTGWGWDFSRRDPALPPIHIDMLASWLEAKYPSRVRLRP